MNRCLPRTASLAVLVLSAAALAMANAPAALADATFSQDLPAGGSLSTGSTVSPSDPLQLTLTAPEGGTFTIDETTAPSQRPTIPDGGTMTWFGPQFAITGSQFQTVTITMLADPAALPPVPTWGANPQWRQDPQKLCASTEGASPGFCITTQADFTHFCEVPTSTLSPPQCTGWGGDDPLGAAQTLSDGDIEATMQVGIGGTSETFAAGYPPWSCGTESDSIVVNSPSFDNGTLADLIAHGVYYGDDCTWASTVSGEITVAAAQARRLHLKSAVIGRITDGPGAGPIDLTAAAKSALRGWHRAIDIRVSLTGHGTQPGESWKDDDTLHVPH